MKKIEKIALGILVCANLIGCVEFKDTDEEQTSQPGTPTHTMVRVQKGDKLLVDRPLYVYEGKLLSEEEFEIYRKAGEEDAGQIKDVEFQFEEVQFLENGALYTMGANVRIHAKKLNSERGKIVTFPEGQKARQGVPGRSGGHIFLNIGTATGELAIEMRGENGGDALPAKAPDENLKGAKGEDGEDGLCVGFKLKRTPTDGKPGGRGLTGYPGNDGQKGGDTGTLEILIKTPNQFTQSVEKNPGDGGVRSLGGAGGEGGEGGSPGSYIQKVICPAAKPGPQGPSGDPGSDGVDGKTGEKQTSCITKNRIMSCYI